MRRLSCGVVLALCSIIHTRLAVADEPAIPEVVYIDPAPFLPEGMKQMVDAALDDVTLSDLAAYVSEKYGNTAVLLESALDDAGITTDEEIDFPAGVPLYQALAVALEDVAGTQLTWVEEDGILKITTEEDAIDRHQVRVYDMPLLDEAWDAQSQIDFIRVFTGGEWINSIGGEIDPAGDVLVMWQTQAVHLETARLLDALSREGRVIRITHPPHHQRLFEALDQTFDIDVESQPLDQALAHISEKVGLPIRMRVSALQDAGITLESPVSYHLGVRPLRSVFKHLLADVEGVELAYSIDNGAITVTTPEDLADRFELALYDVRDLLFATSMSDLLDLVDHNTSDHWYDVDGIGGEYAILPNGYMEIRHTAAVHEEIVTLLSLIRAKLVPSPEQVIDPAAFEVRHYYLTTAMADRLERLLPELIAPETWSIDGDRDGAWISRVRIAEGWGPTTNGRFGRQRGFGGGQGGFFQVPIGPAIRAAHSMPAFQGFGGGGMGQGASATPSRLDVVLIIRQAVAVHEQIADFIEELNDPGHRLGRGERNYQIGPRSHVSEFDAAVRSDVLSDPEWLLADRVDPWRTTSDMPELEFGYVDAAAFVPDMMRQVLEEPIVDVPLMTVAEYISREYGVHVYVHENQLAEAGVASDELVSLPGGLPLYMALDQGLRDVAGTQIDWYFEDDILSITTFDETIDLFFPIVYDVGDLPGTGDDGQWLIDFVQGHTSGEWVNLDGIGGEIDVIGNVLLVRQTHHTHREIGSLLAAMRVDARIVRSLDAASAAAFAALEQPVAIEFENARLSSVAEILTAQLGVPFNVCEKALNDAGLTLDEEITYQQGERPLRQVLDLMLEDIAGTRLTYLIDNGVINITTEEDAVDRLSVNIYQVSDILNAMPLSHGRPDYQEIINLVQAQTSGVWEDINGIGGEMTALPGGRIAVRTTQAVHEEVVSLFANLRMHLTPRIEEAFNSADVETRYYHLLATTADDLQRELPRLIDPETWRSDDRPDAVGVIRDSGITSVDPMHRDGVGFFQIQDDSPPEKPEKDLPEPEPPPEYTWLIITQTAGVHQRIESLLEELAAGVPASTAMEPPRWNPIDMQGVLSEVIK